MAGHREPKVGKAFEGRWIKIVVLVLFGLLILAWLLGWFSDEATEIATADPLVTEEPAVVVVDHRAEPSSAADRRIWQAIAK